MNIIVVLTYNNFMKNYIHYISVISAGILWGLISLFIKKLNSFGFSSLQIIAFRSFFASVILGIVLLIKDPKLFKIKICQFHETIA